MLHGTLDQERRHPLPLVGTFQLEKLVSYRSRARDIRRLTSIHGIGSQKLVSIFDRLRHVNTSTLR